MMISYVYPVKAVEINYLGEDWGLILTASEAACFIHLFTQALSIVSPCGLSPRALEWRLFFH